MLKFLLFVCSLAISDIEQFKQFKQQFSRNYADSVEEKLRFSIFKKNLREIEELNSKRTSPSDAYFGINKFTDRLPEELPPLNLQSMDLTKLKGYTYRIVDFEGIDISNITDDLPANLSYCGNYTSYNSGEDKTDYCGKTFDQRQCGSCYAAAQANLAQTLYAMETKKKGEMIVENFGVQVYLNFTDYPEDADAKNKRCCGGNSIALYENTPYFFLEKDAPYSDVTGKDGVDCTPSGIKFEVKKVMDVTKFKLFGFSKELSNSQYFTNLKKILYQYGPFSASLRVGSQSSQWSSYKRGLFYFDATNCAMDYSKGILPDHAIDVVGYGVTSGGEEYLVIRNSWGDTWGENGYMRIAAQNDGVAMCGIAWDMDTGVRILLKVIIPRMKVNIV